MSLIHRWEQHPTTGTPPLGMCGYASCTIGKDIFYFAGYCRHSPCCHNSLFRLNTETLAWNELFATSETSGPMKKAYCALLAVDGYLLTFGGIGQVAPQNPSKSAKYETDASGRIYTNEHHFYDWKSGEPHLSVVQYMHDQLIVCKFRKYLLSLDTTFL